MHSFPAQGAPSTAPPPSPGTGRRPSKRPTSATPARSTATASTSPARTSAPTAPTRTGSAATRSGSPPTANATPASAKPSTRTQRLAVDLPERQPLPRVADVARALGPRDPSREVSAFRDACRQQPARVLEQLERAQSDPPEHLIRALGPPPDEQIARERWEREAQRLQALQPQTHTVERAAPPRPSVTDPVPSRHAPASPRAPAQRSGPTIRR